MTIPTTEPTEFVRGDTVKWIKRLNDYLPADGWQLNYSFSGEGRKLSAAGTDNGDGSHAVTISATESAKFPAGDYVWQAAVSKSGERYTVSAGRISVKPDISDVASGYDGSSHIKKVLDALEATLEGKASHDHKEISLPGGQSISKLTPEEVIKWHSHYQRLYKQELDAEKIARGEQLGGRIVTRFGRSY